MATNRDSHLRPPATPRHRHPPSQFAAGNVPLHSSSAARRPPVGTFERQQGSRNPEIPGTTFYQPDMQRYHHPDK